MEREELYFKTTELGYTLQIIYDRTGGMTIIKKETTEYGATKLYEVYLPKEAMFSFALKLLKSENCKNVT